MTSASDRPIRILHVITGLELGGAETMLLKLVSNIDRRRFQVRIVTLTDGGPMAPRFEALDVTVETLGMCRGVPDPRGYLRLRRQIKEWRPHIVQTWLYHADLLGGLAARAAGVRNVVWGIRQTDLSRQGNKLGTLATARLCASTSRLLPARIVCCSQAAKESHARFGYAMEKMTVIPNGFDLARFRPNTEARRSIRRALGLADDVRLVGLVARFDPQKDHRNFLLAAAHIAENVDAHFVLCGDGISADNPSLRALMNEARIESRCHLLGPREDIPDILSALDVLVSSSFGEGFSNVIGEAMACAVPCVATDVGDSRLIVGESGRVVAPRHPEALATAVIDLLRMPADARRTLGAAARLRIVARFSLPSVVRQYETLYEQLAPCAE